VTTIDAIIQDSEPDNTPLNFISGCGLGLLRRDFIDALGWNFVMRDLYLGQVFGPEGLLPQWATFIGRRKIIVRGSRNVTFRHCSTCGRPMYFATGTKYLSPKPQEEVAIFDGGNGSLVVSEEIGQSIAPKAWRKLSRTQLTILQHPLDGLRELGVK
jgi:hypothetical protein